MIEFFHNPNYNFLRWKWHFIILSWLLILAGSASLWVKGGPRYGIDFKGGTLVYLKFAATPDLDRIRAGLDREGLGTSTIQSYGRPEGNEVIIGTEQVGREEEALDTSRQAILTALRTTFHVPADKLDLNNSGTDSLTDALLRFDPLGLAGQPGEAAARYREIAERITDFRDNQRGGLLGSFAELRGLEGVPRWWRRRSNSRRISPPSSCAKPRWWGREWGGSCGSRRCWPPGWPWRGRSEE